jgi:chromate reductase
MEPLTKAKILIIIGSASAGSSNSKLMEVFSDLTRDDFEISTVEELGILPHFDPGLVETTPSQVSVLISRIQAADGVVICTPEYIFSIPARLKNLLEWCVTTTIFNEKPVGLITASAQGQEGHAQLKRIMQTLGARLSEKAEMIIPGIKGKFDSQGQLKNQAVIESLSTFAATLKAMI